MNIQLVTKKNATPHSHINHIRIIKPIALVATGSSAGSKLKSQLTLGYLHFDLSRSAKSASTLHLYYKLAFLLLSAIFDLDTSQAIEIGVRARTTDP